MCKWGSKGKVNFSERLKFERRRGELPWDVTKRILPFFSVVKVDVGHSGCSAAWSSAR